MEKASKKKESKSPDSGTIKIDSNTLWDVAVIGGGPAGMMAAGRAAETGAKVILIEKNDGLGKKLLITGGGRCNVTNSEFDNRKLLEKFKENSKYLFSAFSQWSVKETLDFFHGYKMETKIEALQRVFPKSDQARSVWNVLVEYMKQGNVTVISNSPVIGFATSDKKEKVKNKQKINRDIVAVKLKGNIHIRAKSFILATGGKSHPETGSTGEGFEWLKQLGHTIIEPSASLVPIAVKDLWVKKLQGVTLQNVKISLFQNEIKHAVKAGRVLFTHFGLSGPTILNLSGEVSELLKYGEVKITIDIMPELDYGKLNEKLQEIFKEHSNKKIVNSLSTIMLPSVAQVIMDLSEINPDTWSHSVTREQRLLLVQLLKAIPLEVKNLLGVEKAIVTSGGVVLDEIDFKTMQSRLFPNLYLIGDILNIDRPSGGYSLQLCWTTGFVAGNYTGTKK
jgi:predicted Rossmann fold flavoprotein